MLDCSSYVVNEFIKCLDDICIPIIKPSQTSGKYKLSLPLATRQLKRVSKLLRNFAMFREAISPVVYERVVWNFMCGRVLPSIVCNLNVVNHHNEGVNMAISICEVFVHVLPTTPLYGNQLSKSRYELITVLGSIIQNIKDLSNNGDGHSAVVSLEHHLKQIISIGRGSGSGGGGAAGSVVSREVVNKNAAEAFLAMNASAML